MANILVADDDRGTLLLLEKELTAQGHTVTTAGSGRDMIRVARIDLPDLMLIDILMPDMNGPEAVRELRSDPRTHRIPMLFITAILSKEQQEKDALGIRVGEEYYPAIAKPINRDELNSKVKALLHDKQ